MAIPDYRGRGWKSGILPLYYRCMNLTIGRLSSASGTSVQTIRFYEREGLLELPPRNTSGYRVYGEDALSRLRFIHHAQSLGFTLKEIRELIALQTQPDAGCGDVRRAAEEKLSSIHEKVAALVSMQGELERLVESCAGTGPVAECRLMESLTH